MTLIDKAETLDPCPFCGGESDVMTPEDDQMRKAAVMCMGCYVLGPERETSAEAIAAWNRRAALPARGVGVKPDAAEMLAKEIQAIVAADRWKGRDLNYAPPEKWNHLRPETQQFWIDTATRILSALAPTDAAQAREAALREASGVLLGMMQKCQAAMSKDGYDKGLQLVCDTLGAADAAILALIREPRT